MSNLDEIDAWLRERLPGLLAEHRVPGAAVGVLAEGRVIDHAAGVLSRSTGVEATADSLFQVGSITKVWTATLVMQLVDDGLVDIDAPVRRYLPEFRVADEAASDAMTVRQLLCHTAGFEGDIFTDTGRGDDCVEKYVATLAGTPQLFPPGEMFSYNNAGYCVLGRLVEVLRGKPFDDCLRERLFAPLGLTHAAPSPYEAILHRAAVGHIRPEPDAEPQPAPIWALVRSNGPAGAMLAMRARDLLAFARMHLAGGTAAGGTAAGGTAAGGTVVLGADAVKAMREPQVSLPPLGLMGDRWGLGWEMYDLDGRPAIGHDGGTIGQSAFLRIVPDRDVAVTLLTNGGDALAVYTEIFGHLLRELAGVELPPLPEPPAESEPIGAKEAERYVGRYASGVAELTVSRDGDGRLWLEQVPKGVLAELGAQVERKRLVRLDGATFVPAEAEHGLHAPHVFVGDDGHGRALYLHTGRATRRIG